MRIGVVDIGTNSTRLLVADVGDDGLVEELQRDTVVTRLGQGVDASGRLAGEAMDRVFAVLRPYRAAIEQHGCEATTAVLTSAVRDAANGADFVERVRTDYGLDARVIPGDEEARLTFLGATSERPAGGGPVLVIDIGGGSTEFVVGVPGGEVSFYVSTQAGVVRQTERFLGSDPPEPAQLRALAAEVVTIVEGAIPVDVRRAVRSAIAVAGTATSCAAIDQELEPYDPERVHGYELPLGALELQLARLAQMDNDERRQVDGLHPDRAPTIVAGIVILIEALRAFDLERSPSTTSCGGQRWLAHGSGRAGSNRRNSALDVCSIAEQTIRARYSLRRVIGVLAPKAPPHYTRPIGTGEAASNRRLPPPVPPNPALSWHVPLPVLTGPL